MCCILLECPGFNSGCVVQVAKHLKRLACSVKITIATLSCC